MKRTEYEAIKARAQAGLTGSIGPANVVIVCVDKQHRPIHPDSLGPDFSLQFQMRAEAFALAAQDRAALVDFIERCFEIEWPETETVAPESKAS